MEEPYRELAQYLHSGAAVSISQYLRKFEEDELIKSPSKETFTFHLFACYITGNLIHSKLLWKRAPKSLKGPGEIEKVWEIGKYLLKSNIPSALKLINSHHWILSEHIAKLLKKKLFEDIKKRIQSAYISIELSKFAEYFSVPQGEARTLCQTWDWKIEQEFVYPVQASPRRPRGIEDHDINIITELVNFLEQKAHIGID